MKLKNLNLLIEYKNKSRGNVIHKSEHPLRKINYIHTAILY